MLLSDKTVCFAVLMPFTLVMKQDLKKFNENVTFCNAKNKSLIKCSLSGDLFSHDQID